MFFEQQFVVYHDDGKVEFIDDLYAYISRKGSIETFVSNMKYNISEFQERRQAQYGWYTRDWYTGWDCKFFICTASGLMVSPDLIYGEYTNIYYHGWIERIETRRKVLSHKHGQNQRHSYTRYKKLQTHPARRAAAGVVLEDGEPEFRGKRKAKSIPTYWDDIRTRRSCSWKNSTKRKNQYKGS